MPNSGAKSLGLLLLYVLPSLMSKMFAFYPRSLLKIFCDSHNKNYFNMKYYFTS
jgi:hypothetical protein